MSIYLNTRSPEIIHDMRSMAMIPLGECVSKISINLETVDGEILTILNDNTQPEQVLIQ